MFLLAAIVFQKAASLTDGWFAHLGAFAFLGVVLDMTVIFLAAFITAGLFLRRYESSRTTAVRLARGYGAAFAVWTFMSFLLIANMFRFAPVTWGLAGFAVGEALVGALMVWAAVMLRAGLLERNLSRRAASGGVI